MKNHDLNILGARWGCVHWLPTLHLLLLFKALCMLIENKY